MVNFSTIPARRRLATWLAPALTGLALLATAGAAQAQTFPVSTLAGTGTAGSTDRPVASASFNFPTAVDGSGAEYVTDRANSKIRKSRAAGVVSTVTAPTNNALAFVVASNNALDFDGTNDIVNLGMPASLQFGTGDFTAETWLRNDRPNSV